MDNQIEDIPPVDINNSPVDLSDESCVTPVSPRSLASIAGLVNAEMGQINNNIVGDHSKLKTNKITESDIYQSVGISKPQPSTREMKTSTQSISPVMSAPVAMPTSITIDTTDIEKYKKKTDKSISTIKRKITKLEKDVETLANLTSFAHTRVSYQLTTENIDCKCNNTNTLINTLLVELQSKPASVTITRV